MFPQAFADPQESVDVSSVQEKYWNQGEENEIGVVQNRKYSSDHKFELGTFTGTISSDPFLDVHPYGLSLGYHFDSIWSVHVRGWKNSVGPSDALIAFQQKTGATVDTNNPKSFWGAEINANILYGKLSLLGAMIIYNDL